MKLVRLFLECILAQIQVGLAMIENTIRQLAAAAPGAHCGPSVSHNNPMLPGVGKSVSELYANAPDHTESLASHSAPSRLL